MLKAAEKADSSYWVILGPSLDSHHMGKKYWVILGPPQYDTQYDTQYLFSDPQYDETQINERSSRPHYVTHDMSTNRNLEQNIEQNRMDWSAVERNGVE